MIINLLFKINVFYIIYDYALTVLDLQVFALEYWRHLNSHIYNIIDMQINLLKLTGRLMKIK